MGLTIRLYRLGSRLTPDSIEPSCGIMDIVKGSTILRRVMTDSGLIPRFRTQGNEQRWHVPDLSMLEDGKKIDAVRITHVHGDHFGYLPAVERYLAPDAKVWMSRPSAAMGPHILEDGIAIHGRRNDPPPYDTLEMFAIRDRIRVIPSPGEYEIVPGFTDYVNPEAHIPGACSYTTDIEGVNFHYSGDRCSYPQPGIDGAQLLQGKRRPHVIAGSDCTYGADLDSDKRTWQSEMDRGYDLIAEALKAGKPVLVFTLGIHRGGALAHEMARRGLTDLGNLYLDGATQTFAEIQMSDEGKWCELDRPLSLANVRFVKGMKREDILNSQTGFAVFSTPGFGGPGGIGTWWRRSFLPDPDATVVFSSFVPPDADGGRILAADRKRELTGVEPELTFEIEDEETKTVSEETLTLRCKVFQMRTGSHDPRVKIIRWFEEYDPEVAILTHGSEESFTSLAGELSSIPHLFRGDQHPVVEIEI